MRYLFILILFMGCLQPGFSDSFSQGGTRIGGKGYFLKGGNEEIRLDTVSETVLGVASNTATTNSPDGKKGAIQTKATPPKTPDEQGISPADGNWRFRIDRLINDGFISTNQERYWKSGIVGKGAKTQECWSIILRGVDTNAVAVGSWWKTPANKKIVYDRIVKDNANGKPYMVYNVVASSQPAGQPLNPGSKTQPGPTGFREARPAGSADGTFAANTNKTGKHSADIAIESVSPDKVKGIDTGGLNVDNLSVEILPAGTNQSTGLRRPQPAGN